MMYKRKLTALGHANPDKFDVTNESMFRQMVVWLEDMKIRHYTIDGRAGLRSTDSDNWPAVFRQYLTDLECPHVEASRREVLDWLLGCAIKLEYGMTM